MDWNYDVDVAVVGGGGCGLMTALQAGRNSGLQVVVFEKRSCLMSNTEISSGTLAAGGTRFQREAGIDDSPERCAEDIQRKNHGKSDADIVLALCRTAPCYVEWLADDLKHHVELST